MLDVRSTELLRSRNRQEAVAGKIEDNCARRLLLFYAVECGVKYQLLVNENYFIYTKLSNDDRNLKHDLQKLLKRIGLEQKCNMFPDLHSALDGETIDASRYHEMWRYGIRCREGEALEQIVENNLKQTLSLLHDCEARR
ncbi:MAG: hypothetical protein NC124_20640 [Clostridium sp.]|nr:hypothetical protein [Clostridium sp.]MCM1539858.1 hypothetical protein [Blautia sp.]